MRYDKRTQGGSKSTYKEKDKKSIEPDNLIDVFYIDNTPFYIRASDKK